METAIVNQVDLAKVNDKCLLVLWSYQLHYDKMYQNGIVARDFMGVSNCYTQ